MSKFRQWLTSWPGGIVIGIVIAVAANLLLDLRDEFHERNELITSFISDIKALRAKHAERLIEWPEHMKRLREVDNPLENSNARRWLMPEFADTSRFAVFEANTGKLGLLENQLAEQVARFYAKSEMLKAEVRVLASPNIIWASGGEEGDKAWLIDKNKVTQKYWDEAADAILKNLEDARSWLWELLP